MSSQVNSVHAALNFCKDSFSPYNVFLLCAATTLNKINGNVRPFPLSTKPRMGKWHIFPKDLQLYTTVIYHLSVIEQPTILERMKSNSKPPSLKNQGWTCAKPIFRSLILRGMAVHCCSILLCPGLQSWTKKFILSLIFHTPLSANFLKESFIYFPNGLGFSYPAVSYLVSLEVCFSS